MSDSNREQLVSDLIDFLHEQADLATNDDAPLTAAKFAVCAAQLASLQADAAALGTLEKLVRTEDLTLDLCYGTFRVKDDAMKTISEGPTLREAIEATNQSGDNSGQMHNEGEAR